MTKKQDDNFKRTFGKTPTEEREDEQRRLADKRRAELASGNAGEASDSVERAIADKQKANTEEQRLAGMTPEQVEREKVGRMTPDDRRKYFAAKRRAAMPPVLAATVTKVDDSGITVLFPAGVGAVPNDCGELTIRQAYVMGNAEPPQRGKVAVKYAGEIRTRMTGTLVTDGSQPQFTVRSIYETASIIAPSSCWLFVLDKEQTVDNGKEAIDRAIDAASKKAKPE